MGAREVLQDVGVDVVELQEQRGVKEQGVCKLFNLRRDRQGRLVQPRRTMRLQLDKFNIPDKEMSSSCLGGGAGQQSLHLRQRSQRKCLAKKKRGEPPFVNLPRPLTGLLWYHGTFTSTPPLKRRV